MEAKAVVVLLSEQGLAHRFTGKGCILVDCFR